VKKQIKYKDRIYNSIQSLADELKITSQSIGKSLRLGQKVKGHKVKEIN